MSCHKLQMMKPGSTLPAAIFQVLFTNTAAPFTETRLPAFGLAKDINPAGVQVFGILVRPKANVDDNRQQVGPFIGKAIQPLLTVCFVSGLTYNACFFQHGKPVGQYIGRNAFGRTEELVVMPLAEEHKVANDQQRPFIAKQLKTKI